MTYNKLKVFTILLPTLLIGGFEYVRHELLIDQISMEAGNLYITILTFVLSYIFATWMFKKIDTMNQRIVEEQSKRAVYEEQERLARELHDNIAQVLFFLKVKLKQGDLTEARMAVNEIDHNVRQAIFNLRTMPHESVDLTNRLGKWLNEWCDLTGIEITKQVEISNAYFTVGEEVQLFGIIQEAFTNIRKHSQATQAILQIKTEPQCWQMTISDNGRGFAPYEESPNQFGLKMISERAQKIGAELELGVAPMGGAQLILRAQRKVKP